jgi:hypothetical protein
MYGVVRICTSLVAVALLLWWMFELPGSPTTPGYPPKPKIKNIKDLQNELNDLGILVEPNDLTRFQLGVTHHLKGLYAQAVDDYNTLQTCNTNNGIINLVEQCETIQYNIRDAKQRQHQRYSNR